MNQETLLALMMDLHRDGARQGPGSEAETLRALELTRIDPLAKLQVADIGCGTGASTLVLASKLQNAQITAIDIFPEFLDVLSTRARAMGYSEKIETLTKSMDKLSFADESLDLIWSEGAIYNLGFAQGIESWRRMLRTGGVLAVSEITWLNPLPPEEIRQHWNTEYPEIATASEKITILEHGGYDLLGYFILPSTNWLENYYMPIEDRIDKFLQRHGGQLEAEELIKMERREMDLYRRFKNWFSYGFYVARKR
ncbi:methyltransferase domain-containing protein [Synechocystis salina LEGE 06099]|uniref:class I SAM-dependent methyltransferase n=1 Tax=Synechocystis salina TaxID=945780 RepID=UPI00187F0FA1|nr:class I SAM-dependent methyltransferase [Synechocystis salina]MBE9203152.1 methyltransferase domain-containing protein [Synechocystis salina LEGE 06099]